MAWADVGGRDFVVDISGTDDATLEADIAEAAEHGATGVLLASNLTGTVVGPLVVGQLANRGAYPWAWTICSTLAFAASAFMLASWRSSQLTQKDHSERV